MTATEIRKCEWREDGRKCAIRASFLVSRKRRYDAQDSCRRHLAATVDALMEGQDVPVTVTLTGGAA